MIDQTNSANPDDFRECSFCAELIKKKAVLCKHCHSKVPIGNISSHQVDLSRKFPILPVLILGILALLVVSMIAWFTLHGAKSGSLLDKGTLNGRDVQKSCRNFVQRFYNGGWKGEKCVKPYFQPDIPFAPELLKLLNERAIANEKSGNYLDGLDCDPVLNAQDIAEKYTAGKITSKGDHFLVEVYGTWNGKKNDQPDVVPELMLQNSKWTFVNFDYPKRDGFAAFDLINQLRELARDRQKRGI